MHHHCTPLPQDSLVHAPQRILFPCQITSSYAIPRDEGAGAFVPSFAADEQGRVNFPVNKIIQITADLLQYHRKQNHIKFLVIMTHTRQIRHRTVGNMGEPVPAAPHLLHHRAVAMDAFDHGVQHVPALLSRDTS